MSHRPRRFGPAVAWSIIVGAASVTPAPWLGGASTAAGLPVDLVLHALAYAILAALLVRADVTPLVAVVAAASVGLGLEAVQTALPYRSLSFADAVANLVGATIGALLARSALGRTSPVVDQDAGAVADARRSGDR